MIKIGNHIIAVRRGIAFLLSSVMYFSGVRFAFASTACPAGWQSLCQFTLESGPHFTNIYHGIILLAALGSLIFLVLGGIRWAASGGDKNKIERARKTLIAAIVGLFISILAYVIVALLYQFFTGQEWAPMTIPTLV